MSPADLIEAAAADGVTLGLTPQGTVSAKGAPAAVKRWLPRLAECKAAVVTALGGAEVGDGDTVSRCWWIHFADREPVECWSSPPASHAEILESRPDAIAAEPFEPDDMPKDSRHGGEGASRPDPDDRRYCRDCRNLRGAVCSVARPEAGALVIGNRGYRPVLDLPVRCAGFAGGADRA